MDSLFGKKNAPSEQLLVQTLQRLFDPRMRRPGAQGDDDVMGSSWLDTAMNRIELWKGGRIATDQLKAEIMEIADTYASIYEDDFSALAEGTRSRTRSMFPTKDPDKTVLARRLAQYRRLQERREQQGATTILPDGTTVREISE